VLRHPAQRAPGLMWLTPEDIARCALDGMDRNARVLVPELRMRTGVALARLVPERARLAALSHLPL
jgi:short-subunit dehydrogenase